MTETPSFRIGDVVLYKDQRYVFMGYAGKTSTIAEIMRYEDATNNWTSKHVRVKSLTHRPKE